MPENWKPEQNAVLSDMQMRHDVIALDAKYTKELADAKAEMMLCVMMCCRWSSSVAHQQSVVSAWSYPLPPAWITQPPPRLADTAEWDYFDQREADHYAKTTEGTQKYINELVQIELAHIDGQLAIIVAHTRASSGV